MIRIAAREFWPAFRDEVRRQCTTQTMSGNWHVLGIEAAETVCHRFGLETSYELTLDVGGYERRVKGMWYDSDLRVAFEHEVDHPYPYRDDGRGWQCEIWKLCHIVADLRVLVGYYKNWKGFADELHGKIALMGDRMLRVPKSEWLFVFGAYNSYREPQPWRAWTIDNKLELQPLDDDDPFCPAEHCGRRHC